MHKHFFTRLIIFLIPVIIVLLGYVYLGFTIGELQPIPIMIRAQQGSDDDWILQPSWSIDELIDYKYSSVIMRRPEIIVFGSSRLFGFREHFFNRQPDAFYNAAIAGLGLKETEAYLLALEADNALPSIIIFGVEYIDFNGDSILRGYLRRDPQEQSFQDTVSRFMQDFRFTAKYLVLDQRPLNYILDPDEGMRRFGIAAINTGRGYLPDGSYYIPNIDETFVDARLSEHREHLQNGQQSYVTGQIVHEGYLARLENILTIAQRNQVEIIGVLPPIHSEFYQALITEERFAYVPQVKERLDALFEQFDYPLYDFHSADELGGTDAELYDSHHAGEVLSLRMYLEILRNHHDLLDSYSDEVELEQLLEQAEHPIYLFANNYE